MSSFVQWVSTKANELVDPELRQTNAAKKYLDEHYKISENEYDIDIKDVFLYVNEHYPLSLRKNEIQKRMSKAALKYDDKYGEDAVSALYDAVGRETTAATEDYFDYIFRNVPILFFKYDKLFSVFAGNFQSIFHRLNVEQRVRYADKALAVNGFLIRDIPVARRTESMYKLAVETYGTAIQYVPREKRTPMMIHTAILGSAYALEFLTEEEQVKYFEDCVLNPGSLETNWPSDLWSKPPPWLQKIFKKIKPKTLATLKKKWQGKKDAAADRWHSAHA